MKKCFYCGEKILRRGFPKMTNYNWNLKNFCNLKHKKDYWNLLRGKSEDCLCSVCRSGKFGYEVKECLNTFVKAVRNDEKQN